MTTYTKQETFDTVARHLLRQSEKSIDPMIPGSGCAYRGADGRKCAAGCLIPDSSYGRWMEDRVVTVVLSRLDADDFFGHEARIVADLQNCHDSVQVDKWKSDLLRIGLYWELDCSVLDSFKWDEDEQRYVDETQ